MLDWCNHMSMLRILTCVVGLTYLLMTLAVLRGGLVPIAALLA
jgi:hypothetical protein